MQASGTFQVYLDILRQELSTGKLSLERGMLIRKGDILVQQATRESLLQEKTEYFVELVGNQPEQQESLFLIPIFCYFPFFIIIEQPSFFFSQQ